MKKYIIYARNYDTNKFRVKHKGILGLICRHTLTENRIISKIKKGYKYYTKNNVHNTLTEVIIYNENQLRTIPNATKHDNLSGLPISYKLEQ